MAGCPSPATSEQAETVTILITVLPGVSATTLDGNDVFNGDVLTVSVGAHDVTQLDIAGMPARDLVILTPLTTRIHYDDGSFSALIW